MTPVKKVDGVGDKDKRLKELKLPETKKCRIATYPNLIITLPFAEGPLEPRPTSPSTVPTIAPFDTILPAQGPSSCQTLPRSLPSPGMASHLPHPKLPTDSSCTQFSLSLFLLHYCCTVLMLLRVQHSTETSQACIVLPLPGYCCLLSRVE